MSSNGLIPGVEIVKRPMHMYFLIDCSTSMLGERMNAVNQGVPAAIHAVQQAMRQHPEVNVYINILRIGTEAEWITGEGGTPLSEFQWADLDAKGKTKTGHAINQLCDRMEVHKIGDRGYPPVCILISDGYFTESQEYYDGAINRLNHIPWGIKAVRLVIAIGREDDYDGPALLKFVNQPNVGLIQVEHYKEIMKYIKWATVAATLGSTRSKSALSSEGQVQGNVVLPAVPKQDEIW